MAKKSYRAYYGYKNTTQYFLVKARKDKEAVEKAKKRSRKMVADYYSQSGMKKKLIKPAFRIRMIVSGRKKITLRKRAS